MAIFYETKSGRYFKSSLKKVIEITKYLSNENRSIKYFYSEIIIKFGLPWLKYYEDYLEDFSKVILILDWTMKPNHPIYRIEYI